MSIVLLAGSPSATSRSTRLLQHIGEQLALRGHRQLTLQVRDLPAGALLHGRFHDPRITEAREQIERADAVVIATPVYKASYSGLLKAFLDLLPQDGFAGKLVLPLATGGSQAHMLVLDYALRPVLSSLGATHVLPGIYATESQIDTQDGLVLDPALGERVAAGVEQLSAALLALPRVKVQSMRPLGSVPLPPRKDNTIHMVNVVGG
jgi:FMN reductase